jgi:hypothetical protein
MGAPRRPSGPLAPQRSVVVYDTESGAIIQIHHFSAMPGAELPPHDELRGAALREAARRHGRDANVIAAIAVEPDELRPGIAYRVSVTRQVLERDESS